MAQEALQDFFQHNGYFQASIRADSQIDDEKQIVNVNFVVNLGKQARVASVKIEGVASPEDAHLLHSIRSLRARLTGGLAQARQILQ